MILAGWWTKAIAAQSLHHFIHRLHQRREVQFRLGAGFFKIRTHAFLGDFFNHLGAELLTALHVSSREAFGDFLEPLFDKSLTIGGRHLIERLHEAVHALGDGEVDEQSALAWAEQSEKSFATAVLTIFFTFMKVESIREVGDFVNLFLTFLGHEYAAGLVLRPIIELSLRHFLLQAFRRDLARARPTADGEDQQPNDEQGNGCLRDEAFLHDRAS